MPEIRIPKHLVVCLLTEEERYIGIQRLPSHAVHGTWVDLLKNHLEYDAKTDVFSPDPRFSWVDARALAPIAIFVLEATKPYVERFFPGIPESKLVLDRIDDLHKRLIEADAVHEKLMTKRE